MLNLPKTVHKFSLWTVVIVVGTPRRGVRRYALRGAFGERALP
jgi:hypothetical protein